MKHPRVGRPSPCGFIAKRALYLAVDIALFLLCTTVAVALELDALDYPRPTWSPYVAGAGIGMLSWLTFYFADHPIGVSSFYAQFVGLIGKHVARHHTASLAYFKDNPPRVGWEFVFVLAIIIGSAIAALTGGEFAPEWLSPMWIARFGDNMGLRGVVAFGGGVLVALGARLAGGCTSGHAISGTLQLSMGSWIAGICFFIGGILVALPLFG